MHVLSHLFTAVAESADKEKSRSGETVAPAGSVPYWRSGLLLVLALALYLGYWLNPPPTLSLQSGVIMDLPNQIGHYHGVKAGFSSVELENLPEDTGLARKNYDDFMGHQVQCSIILSGAEQSSIHRAESCLRTQGWDIVKEVDTPVQLVSRNPLNVQSISLTRQVVGQDNVKRTIRAYYLYWFVGENVTTDSHFKRFLLSGWDRMFYNRAHRWAYVSVFSYVTDNMRSDGLNPEQTEKLLTDFIRDSVPYFQKSEMPQQTGN